VTLPVVNNFTEVDLGTIRVDPAVLGAQRWQGRIDAYSTVIGDTVDVDYLLLVPAAEGYALARGEYAYSPGVQVARDEFTGIVAGTVLNARVAPSGGTWATSGVAATDFAAADAPLATDETVSRSTLSDTTLRFAVLGATNFTDTEVGVDCQVGVSAFTWNVTLRASAIARWVDASNRLTATFQGSSLILQATVAGVVVSSNSVAGVGSRAGVWYTLRIVAFASGVAIATLVERSSGAILATTRIQHTSLATGGALATGKPGFADQNTSSLTSTRYYDNFYAATPAAEPVAIYSTQSLEVRSDLAKREDSTGAYYGDPPAYRGSRFTVPPAGAAARKARIAAKARRNDVLVNPDDQIADSLAVAVSYTPVFLAIPR
jgi:hypothetical protein